MPSPRMLLVAIFPLLLATACTHAVYHAKAPDTNTACAMSMQSLQPVALLPLNQASEAKLKYAEFADISRCVVSPGNGKPEAVALYRFEDLTPPAEVDISSLLSPGGTFATSADLLDQTFHSVRHYPFGNFVRRGSTYSLSIFLNPADSGVRYLLISPDEANVGRSDVAIGTQSANVPVMVVPGAMVLIVNGHESRVIRPFTEGGLIKVAAHSGAGASL